MQHKTYIIKLGKVVHHLLLQNEIILFWLTSENEIKRTQIL